MLRRAQRSAFGSAYSSKKLFIGITLSLIVFYSLQVSADTEPDQVGGDLQHVALRLKAAEKALEKRLLSESLRLHFYGYLDASYTQNFNNPSNRINQLRIFDVNSNQSRPNLAQFILEREATAGSWIDRAGFHVKFNAGRDSDFIGGTNLSQWADFQEFYVQYLAPAGTGLDLKIGQINSLVGYEVVESPHNANYSRSWLFGLGQPFTTRGIRGSSQLTKSVSLSVGVVNHINSSLTDDRNEPWIESALTFAPSTLVKLTLYGLVGDGLASKGTTWGDVLLGGGYLSVQATSHASVVLESYYANLRNGSSVHPGKNARWDGVAGYLIYDVNEQWGMRFRAEIFEDAGGFVSCRGTTDYQPRANVCFGAGSAAPATAVAQTLWELTSTVQFKPTPSLITRMEYRYDKSNQNVFQVGGRAISYQPTLSFEVIYLF